MDSITLGDISFAVSFLVTLIGGLGFLLRQLKKWMGKAFDGQVESISKEINEQIAQVQKEIKSIEDKLDTVDREATKNFIVAQLSEIEKGNWWDSIETERFWEQYEHYVSNGGNTYIKERVEKLKKEGKI